MPGAWDKAIAESKISFLEKYGWTYSEDLDIIKHELKAKVDFSPDRSRAVLSVNGKSYDVEVKSKINK